MTFHKDTIDFVTGSEGKPFFVRFRNAIHYKSETLITDEDRGAIYIQYRIQDNCNDIVDWLAVYRVLQEAGLATYSMELTKKAFENSYRVVFVFDNDLVIGVGRAISDGAYQAAVYDIAVLPTYQRKKVGNLIMSEIHKGLPNISTILYARPGAEGFYKKIGYSKMLTGMASFTRESIMREKGFIE